MRSKIKVGRHFLFLFVCFISPFIISKVLLFPQQKARGIFMTDMAKKAFQEEEEEEEVRG